MEDNIEFIDIKYKEKLIERDQLKEQLFVLINKQNNNKQT